MDFLPRDSDSDYAFRLQMEEALAASLSSQSQTPQRPPSPPIVARCGFAVIEEDDQNEPTATTDVRLKNRGYGFDLKRAVGEGNSKGKGKGKIHETVTGVRRDDQNPNSRNISGNGNMRPSPVIQSQGTVRPAQSVGEGSSRVNAAGGTFNGNVLYRLYFKGLVSEENGKGKMTDVLAGFGVAICDLRDNLLFETKGPLINNGLNRQAAELKALIRGLNEAVKLGIKHMAICCDSFPIFQYVRGRYMTKQKKISLLLNDLQRIMQQFSSSQPILVAGQDVKFAYKLARESIVSKVTPHVDPRQAKAARKVECVICYNDTAAERMFSVDKCRHRFCFHCVKQHVEVKLLHGMVPKCPHYGCKSVLVIDSCGKLLTPKLIEMWKQRVKENAIPVTERVYCPYPRCSALMSKTKISESAKSLLSVYPDSGVRRCVECRGLFCVDCKVPWHGKLSCTEYKKLHPNPPVDDVKLKSLANNKMWRQCGKCEHMIELTQGCNHITCRCGFEFCYQCGGEWNKKTGTCTKRCPAWNVEYIMRQDPAHEHLVPNFFADDEDDEDYEDFDDDYENYYQFVHEMMNGYNRAPPADFDPFFDLPDGVIFTPDMLSPKSRQQFYADDDSDEAEETKKLFGCELCRKGQLDL
ncbi:E3 ubiquitin-protein ligase RSL1 [Cardamine amara subsp. amara]|uniref:RBR-type E3 ubiquitin transferase n=1 Tax=Cardamine amara subsp. amara TaxID=228776 RepID=A0ABD1AWC9_CARAN